MNILKSYVQNPPMPSKTGKDSRLAGVERVKKNTAKMNLVSRVFPTGGRICKVLSQRTLYAAPSHAIGVTLWTECVQNLQSALRHLQNLNALTPPLEALLLVRIIVVIASYRLTYMYASMHTCILATCRNPCLCTYWKVHVLLGSIMANLAEIHTNIPVLEFTNNLGLVKS